MLFQAKRDDTEDGFAEYTGIHFGGAELSVHKHNRHFHYFELPEPALELHLYLERISFELYVVEIQRAEYFGAIAYKSCG